MKASKTYSLYIFMALIIFTSCGDKANDPTPEEKREMLIGSEWKEMNAVVRKDGEVLPATSWRKPNTFIFYPDGTYREVYVDNRGIATPYSGTWELNDDATQLTLNLYETEVWHIKELKSNSLKVNYLSSPIGGISLEIEANMAPIK